MRFTPIPATRQAEAVAFLNAHAFETPAFVVKPEILRRIEPNGALERIKTSQLRVLNQLMNNARIARLIEQEAIDGAAAYKPTTFFADVRKGIWRELEAPQVKVDAFRRNTQRAYLEVMGDKLNGRTAPTDDTRGLVRGELRRSMRRRVGRCSRRPIARRARISKTCATRSRRSSIRNSRRPAARAAAAAGRPGRGGCGRPEICWPDYAIRLVTAVASAPSLAPQRRRHRSGRSVERSCFLHLASPSRPIRLWLRLSTCARLA